MSFKEKVHRAAEIAKYTGSQAKAGYRGAKELGGKGIDKARSLTVDINEAAKDDKFKKFLADTEKNIDWKENKGDVKEAYIQYQRYEKVNNNYQSLFEGKLKNIVADKTEVKGAIGAHILELARKNPEELRRLEKQIEKTLKSEELISGTQKEIDSYQEMGGNEGIEEKLDTLKQAKSISRVVLQFTRLHKLGFGEKKMMAYQKAKEQYGVEDWKDMKKLIEQSKGDLKKIGKLEDAKVKIKSDFRKARAEVFLDNKTAKIVQDKIKDRITQQFIDADNNSIEDLTKLKNLRQELKNEFSEEGVKRRTGVKKKVLGQEAGRNLDFLHTTAEESEEVDKMINEQLEVLFNKRFEEIAMRAPLDKMETQINKYFQRSEFAGMNRVESAKKLYAMLVKVKEKMGKAVDARVSEMTLIMTKLRPLTV